MRQHIGFLPQKRAVGILASCGISALMRLDPELGQAHMCASRTVGRVSIP